MATRLYGVATLAAPITPTPDAAWQDTTGFVRRLLSATKGASTETRSAVNVTSGANNEVLGFQLVSEPLNTAQTITGTVTIMTRGRELATTDNVDRRARGIRVIQSDGTTVRGTLLAEGFDATSTTELAATLAGYRAANATALSSVSAQAGDRIVVEIGYGLSATGTTPQYDMVIGGNGTDHAATDGDTTGTVPWVEFSQNLTFGSSPTPNDNVGIADAVALARDLSFADAVGVTDAVDALLVPAGAPAPRSSATYASAASEGGGTVPLPSGWQVGDVIYIFWELTATNGVLTIPSGWAEAVVQFRSSGTTNTAHGVMRRVAQSGDTDLALTYTTGRFAAISVAVVNADTTTPEDVTPTTDDNASVAYPSVRASSISPTTAGCLLLTGHAVRNGTNGATTTFDPAAGMTEVNEVTTAVAAASEAALEVASRYLPSSGATGTKTAVATSSSATLINQMGTAIAVRPAAGGTSYDKFPADNVGITDAASVEQSRLPADAVGVTDSASAQQSSQRAPADAVGVTDTTSVEQQRSLSDAVGVTDSVSVTLAVQYDRTPADPVGVTDAVSLTRESAKSDAVGVTDVVSAQQSLDRVPADSVGVTDQASLSREKVQGDSVGITDAASIEQQRAAADLVGVTDAAAVNQEFNRGPADAVGVADAVALARTAAPNDAVGITDQVTIQRSIVITIGDPVGVTDSVQADFTGDQLRSPGDLVGITDQVTVTMQVNRTVSDSIGITDARVLERQVAPSDVVGVADTASTQVAASRTVADNVGVVDSVSLAREKTISDLVGITDARTISWVYERVIDDQVGITDQVSRIILIARVVDDQIGITDEAIAEGSQSRLHIMLGGVETTVEWSIMLGGIEHQVNWSVIIGGTEEEL